MEKSKKIIKIVYGIDMSEEKFEGAQGNFYDDMEREANNNQEFSNDEKGFRKYLKYTEQHHHKVDAEGIIETWYVVEATGIYHENLIYFLASQGKNVHVALPNKVKYFRNTLKTKGKNDKLDAKAVTLYGLEKQLEKWEAPSEEMKKLKELTRELTSKTEYKTMLTNQLHARQRAYKTSPEIIKGLNKDIAYIKRRITEIKKSIMTLIKSYPELYARIKRISTYKGIGIQTVATVLAETNEFSGIKNRGQITSYSGLDIIEDQSGKHEGKRKISKKGNSHIRRALYMPALTCFRCNPKMKALYERVNKRYGWKAKKIGIVAVMRKLILIIYAMWKNGTEYNPSYDRK